MFRLFPGDCSAKYLCIKGSDTSTPTDGITGQLCPEGHYCTAGTPAPSACPVGTWSNSTGLGSVDECQACRGGYFCDSNAMIFPGGKCDGGFYCDGNATVPNPTDGLTGDVCPVGHYCPNGTAVPKPCEEGTFMTNVSAEVCWVCPAGYYCRNSIEPEPCPAGYFCPEGTGQGWQPCPKGTFSSIEGLLNVSQCTQCSGGEYCDTLHAITTSGHCDAGFYCTLGSDTKRPVAKYKGVAGPCPTGHYCPAHTETPVKCPEGTFNKVTMLTGAIECTDCVFGMYCGEEGLTEPSGECWAGFFCLEGAKYPNAPTTTISGGPCPVGHFCPNGTSNPLGCHAGTYNPSEGKEQCDKCPSGFFCPENSTDFASNICPTGHYCPDGTKHANEYPCEKGFYNDATGKKSNDDCKPCDPGDYCGTSGLDAPSGQCAPGWFCFQGAWSDSPIDIGNFTSPDCFCPDNKTGGQCQPGTFCPKGSNQPQACLKGK